MKITAIGNEIEITDISESEDKLIKMAVEEVLKIKEMEYMDAFRFVCLNLTNPKFIEMLGLEIV
ncbi:hypothetical protein [uncultured Ilyobacter sp.]|uniref:hypothetical protein n=1 Tax=uncultured Ilyobacter sp. TaxID=544433 RepID=UPI0029C6744A|nr:hypothetical protein [uncultured Ilyobacter sp.]